MSNKVKYKLLLFTLLLFAAYLRFTGFNWDSGLHLHPDERFLTMVANATSWPSNISQYFDQKTSPLNPANVNFSFFVYGTFPLFFVKAVSDLFHTDSYEYLTLTGRLVSAFFDLLTLIFIIKICQSLTDKKKSSLVSLLAGFFYTVSVLPIQISHYFAVDTFLVTFLIITFFLLIKIHQSLQKRLILFSPLISLTGLSFGLALACKISAILFAPIIILAIFYSAFSLKEKFNKKLLFILASGLNLAVFTYLAFRLFNPYAFATGNIFNPSPNPLFIKNLQELASFNHPEAAFPPAVQWVNASPWMLLRTFFYYGVGLPLGFLILGALFFVITKIRKITRDHSLFFFFLSVLWVVGLFIYQSLQFSKPMRYLAPLYPFSSVLAAFFALSLIKKRVNQYLVGLIMVLTLIWCLMFTGIYRNPTTRLTASKWIYENIPAGFTITCDHWDDCLPYSLPGKDGQDFIAQQYKGVQLTLYDPDTPEKMDKLKETLEAVDYVIFSSNRLFGSIPSVPSRYPLMTKFYDDLFSEKLDFKPMAQFTSRPNLPIPGIKICLTLPGENYGYVSKKIQECDQSGITIVDDYTDESFTVYDHPKVVIFKKTISSPSRE